MVSSFLPPEMLATGSSFILQHCVTAGVRLLQLWCSCFLAGATGRVSLVNVDAATGSIPVPLQRLAPFDRVLVDAPCTSDAKLHRSAKFWDFAQAFVASCSRRRWKNSLVRIAIWYIKGPRRWHTGLLELSKPMRSDSWSLAIKRVLSPPSHRVLQDFVGQAVVSYDWSAAILVGVIS